MIGKRTVTLLLTAGAIYLTGRALAPHFHRVVVLNPALASALRATDFPGALEQIRRGADPNLQYERPIYSRMENPLHAVARDGTPAQARELLARGATVDAVNGDEQTPLTIAAEQNEPEIVELLLDAGANPNARAYRQLTPLMLLAASENGWGYRTVDETPLIETARLLVQRGADVNAEDERKETALIQAELAHHGKLAAALRRWGAKKGLREALAGLTGADLLYAVRMRDMRAIKRLVAAGASVDVADWEGRTPLMLSFKNGTDIAILQYLLRHATGVPAALNRQDHHGRTALYLAAAELEWWNDAASWALLNAGADMAVRDAHGHTAEQSLKVPGGLLWLNGQQQMGKPYVPVVRPRSR
jgi:ankyrin repeat protein